MPESNSNLFQILKLRLVLLYKILFPIKIIIIFIIKALQHLYLWTKLFK